MAKNVVPEKKVNILGAISDLIILILLCAGSAYGGYWYANKQKPPEPVKQKTEAAAPQVLPPVPPPVKPRPTVDETGKKVETSEESKESKEKKEDHVVAVADKVDKTAKADAAKKPQTKKYWLASSGEEYTGYSITVTVNGTPVDNFFGPGKMVDVTRHVKAGDNAVLFDAKELGEQYNKHKDHEDAVLTVKLVSGPQVQENFKPTDVLISYSRNAAETTDFNDTKHFQKK